MKTTGTIMARVALALLPAGAVDAQQATPQPVPQAVAAQAAPLPYGAPLGAEAARKVMAAAEAEATRNNWGVVIAVVDSGGHLVMMHRLDGTAIASIRIAEGKARTALEFRRPTKTLEDAITGGGVGLRILSVEGAYPLEGGVPIQAEGKIVGAVGVSGVLSSQDAQVARAGAEAAAK
jgi:glc operon protein GlcG